MFFRLTRAPRFLAVVALLLSGPDSPADWNARPAANASPVPSSESADADGGFESRAGLAPDDEPLGDPPTTLPPSSANKPPVIKNFKHTVQGNVVTFTGQVQDENPGLLTVRFGGPSSLDGRAVTTDANGNFTLSVDMGGQIGEVWSKATDALGLESSYAYDNVY